MTDVDGRRASSSEVLRELRNIAGQPRNVQVGRRGEGAACELLHPFSQQTGSRARPGTGARICSSDGPTRVISPAARAAR